MYNLWAATKKGEGCKEEEEWEGKRGRQGWPPTRRAAILLPLWIPHDVCSEEEDKRRVTRSRGKEKEEGKAWAYGEGRLWTP
jgi:hypothetical protein